MNKTFNNFVIAGFVVNDAVVKKFETASIARFGLAYRTAEKKGDEVKTVSDILNIETWCKNDDADKLALMKKGSYIKVEGFFKAETYTDNEGKERTVTKKVATKLEALEVKKEA